ncbi:MAG: MFS transporter, partial [Prevotellaceae bacterium]|nr:MFS transporter [Prevotellaceae bacterium]
MKEQTETLAAGRRFTRAFWVSNTVELFERMAYYAIFIVITLYLSNILGFSDVEASLISGLFSGGLYLLPMFSGAYADKIGFRASLLLAFSLLTIGYFGLAVLPTFLQSTGLVDYASAQVTFHGLQASTQRWIIVPILVILVIGGSFIKSVISGSVARETNEANRARGYS